MPVFGVDSRLETQVIIATTFLIFRLNLQEPTREFEVGNYLVLANPQSNTSSPSCTVTIHALFRSLLLAL